MNEENINWFALRGHWVIKKKPHTKDEFYVACGFPPSNVLSIYGIKV